MNLQLKNKIEVLEHLEKEIESFGNTMVDGAIDNEIYLNSKYKIAWFLKESYNQDDDGISRFYRNMFDGENIYESFFKSTGRPTWHPIVYISYSILNGFKNWQDLKYIREKEEMCNVINNIAIINANKHYSETGTYTDDNNLLEGFKKFEKILKKQINLLDPNVLIFGNTFNLFKEFFKINESHKIVELSLDGLPQIYFKDSKIYVDAYHPAYPKKQHGNYINSIINAVKTYSDSLITL